jgi:hypothetical protein
MLLPVILEGISIILLGTLLSLDILLKLDMLTFSNIWSIGGSLFTLLCGILIFLSFWGLGNRYKNYEIRWRNGVCVGSGRLQ